MEKIFEDKFQIINYYPNNSIFACIWQNTDEMKDDDYKNGLRKQVELVEKYKVKKELFDTTNFTFPITPDLQEWTDNEIYTKKHELGVKQFALVVTSEMLAQLSLEQALEEGKAHLFNPKFFDSRDEALQFLKDS